MSVSFVIFSMGKYATRRKVWRSRKVRGRAVLAQLSVFGVLFAAAYITFSPGKGSTVGGSSSIPDAPQFSHRRLADDVVVSTDVCEAQEKLRLDEDPLENYFTDPFFPAKNTTCYEENNGPIERLRCELKKGKILFHFFIVAVCFLGLAIVCDEFFESSLEAICEHLDLKEDVAGATFMAAGGSAPELFTSIMGVFVAENDIGFGTIVGSAVFNVLFVIAVCAFVTDNLLLTWWPLTRDSVFYCLAIVVLVACVVDGHVNTFESLLLLFMYGMYVFLMSKNEEAEKWMTRQLIASKTEKKGAVYERIRAFTSHTWFEYFIYAAIVANIAVLGYELSLGSPSCGEWMTCAKEYEPFVTEFHCKTPKNADELSKVVDIKRCYDSNVTKALKPWPVYLESLSSAVCPSARENCTAGNACGDYLACAQKDKDADACVAPVADADYQNLVSCLNVDQLPWYTDMFNQKLAPCEEELDSCESAHFKTLNNLFSAIFIIEMVLKIVGNSFFGYWRDPLNAFDGILVILILVELFLSGTGVTGSFRVFRVFRFFRAFRALRFIRLFFVEKVDASTQTEDGDFRRPSILRAEGYQGIVVKKSSVLPEDPSADEVSGAEPTQSAWDENGDDGDDDDDDDDDEPFDPFDVPDSAFEKFTWAACLPLSVAMFLTIPDCRRENWEKLYPATFIMCIAWITLLSYFMVYGATVLGVFFEIPLPVLGLTLLAAGTSIPDLLSSVAVAKRGFGDMAVSSSIGSNVFDILIGLPVPWLVYNLLNGYSVTISSEGLTIMVLTLFIMVAVVVSLIQVSKWVMTKKLGVYMMILYALFMTESLLLEYNIILPAC